MGLFTLSVNRLFAMGLRGFLIPAELDGPGRANRFFFRTEGGGV